MIISKQDAAFREHTLIYTTFDERICCLEVGVIGESPRSIGGCGYKIQGLNYATMIFDARPGGKDFSSNFTKVSKESK
jgi:hypothetical protein